ASGIDCAEQSSAESGPASATEVLRILRYRLASSASAGAERGCIANSGCWRVAETAQAGRGARVNEECQVIRRRHGNSMTKFRNSSRIRGSKPGYLERNRDIAVLARRFVFFLLVFLVHAVASAAPDLKSWSGANPPPPIDLNTVDGQAFQLQQLRGKVV